MIMAAKKSNGGRKDKATYFPWILYALALILTFYLMSHGVTFLRSYLRSVVLFNGGIQGLWAAAGHLARPEQTAKKIGWPSSGFQTEIGGANLAIGITGVLSFFIPTWSMATALIIAIFYGVCAYAHLKDSRNTAPCNKGPMLYNTVVVSATLFLAVIFS